MSEKKISNKEIAGETIKAVIWILILILCVMLFANCSTTKRNYTKEIKTDTVFKTKDVLRTIETKDSVFLHDSIFSYIKGDTIFVNKWHTKIKYLYKSDTLIKTDTIFQSKIDKNSREIIKQSSSFGGKIKECLLRILLAVFFVSLIWIKRKEIIKFFMRIKK